MSLPPICVRVIEGLTYYNVFKCLIDNNLNLWDQSGFNQFLSINQDYLSLIFLYIFSWRFEVTGVFLTLSKDFDKVWQEDIHSGGPRSPCVGEGGSNLDFCVPSPNTHSWVKIKKSVKPCSGSMTKKHGIFTK